MLLMFLQNAINKLYADGALPQDHVSVETLPPQWKHAQLVIVLLDILNYDRYIFFITNYKFLTFFQYFK
jgi:hypothetical protein